MKTWIAGLAFTGVVLASALAVAQPATKPTIVLVHGAFADSSSWNGVVGILEQHGYRVVAVANPLRSVKTDAAYAQSVIASIKTPIVLVGHSIPFALALQLPWAGYGKTGRGPRTHLPGPFLQ
jgi:pimeloyl-ACP methyl ester carboxylesterase